MPKTFKIYRALQRNKIVLSHFEVFYLRLYTHNLSTGEICQFLEVDASRINKIRASLYAKFNTKNWTKIISHAVKNKHLAKKDFIDDAIKTHVLGQTQAIFETYIKDFRSEHSVKDLRDDLFDLYYALGVRLSNNYDALPPERKLSNEEKKFIRKKYAGHTKEDIMEAMEITSDKFNKCAKTIHLKLEVNNWFNVFKKCLMYNLLDVNSDHLTIVEGEIKKSASDIYRLRNLTRLELNEKKLAVYSFLIELYSNIEFNMLFINAAS